MMARKNIFGPSQTSDEMPGEMPGKDSSASSLARSRPLLGVEPPARQASPLGAISQSLDSINAKVRRAEEIEQQLAAGLAIVEIDPDLIDGSFILDRMESTPADHLILVESIRTHGQQVPLLVRPHPEQGNRYQVAYGHRRLRAARDLGRKVRAVVRDLSDEQLVVAQGQEDSARTDLTFIERARFACRLEERKFTRETIMAALSVDKANLSRMISISSRVPPDDRSAAIPPGIPCAWAATDAASKAVTRAIPVLHVLFDRPAKYKCSGKVPIRRQAHHPPRSTFSAPR